ncbi:MAG TPA: AMP-binding protein [Syntrophorhabdaceae bacterium]|nr:AMP-binding protein [Syntrophorhabdaceae bacterium]HQH43998.1 AMP-binding protein [Syntrophorhabdaceae bacterium]HQK47146.1 AMP-binding protein [Syntrophorhabdaceae bacterium]HRR70931.1 AMP-binding protein [Syntrophorhabdaceae bacterium]HRV23324.1 AMP-binding protein [Syntrophorhabdaceae bacterium]
MNIATNLERSAFYFSENPALCQNDKLISYKTFNDMSNRIATGLIEMGLKPGEHVGICYPNSIEWLVFYFGILKAGAVAVTYAYALNKDELIFLTNHSKPKFLLTTEDKLQTFENIGESIGLKKIISDNGGFTFNYLMEKGNPIFKAIDRDRNDIAAILYTGGTTGAPKGVMLTHENINTSAYNVSYSEKSTEKDRAICFLPLNHVFGQVHIMNATVFSAGCLEILSGFDLDKILYLTSQGKVTKLFAVPTIFTRLLSLDGLKEKLGSIRYCFSAAANLPLEIVKQWKESTGLKIHEGYGMTETASAVTFNHYYHHVIGSIGTPVPGVEVQIRDLNGNLLPPYKEGEICIKGPNVMKGFLNNPEATKETFWDNGWLRSGDIGYSDENGYFYIVDRLKDMIITGGENVYPKEVEEAIYQRQEVQECAVIGLPDKEWGEKVVAVIVPKSSHNISPDEMKAFLKTKLAPYKVPKQYIVMNELPKSAAGKILKRELKKIIVEKNN